MKKITTDEQETIFLVTIQEKKPMDLQTRTKSKKKNEPPSQLQFEYNQHHVTADKFLLNRAQNIILLEKINSNIRDEKISKNEKLERYYEI